MCLSKPVCATEAALHLLEIPVISRSRKVHFFDSSLPSQRKKWINSRTGKPCVHPVESYCSRPAACAQFTFCVYFQRFLRKKDKLKRKVTVGRDGYNKYVYDYREEDRIVRFKEYHPGYNPEVFAYNLLLRKVVFNTEAELISPNNTKRTYFDECVLRGLLTSNDDLASHVGAYAQRHLYECSQHDVMVNQILAQYPVEDWPLGSPNVNSDAEHSVPMTPPTPVPMADNLTSTTEFAHLADAVLTSEQERAVSVLKNATGLHCLTGTPGSGKTFTTQYLIHYWRSIGKRVLMVASTGAAAARLGPSACARLTASLLGSLRPRT
jgi:hypothetical protein